MRRSLTNVGGPSALSGDRETASALAACLNVDPDATPPFTHGFHAYPARMHPDIARRAIERFPGDGRVLDPFTGSGTVAVEAVRAGRAFAGGDVSRVALEVAWARTRVWVPDDCRRVERESVRVVRAARDRRTAPPAAWHDWFAPHTLHEVTALRDAIGLAEPADVRRMLVVVLSSVLVKLSRQASDSSTSVDPRARAWPRGAAPRLFAEKASEQTRNLLRLSSDLHKRKVRFVEPAFALADARTHSLGPSAGDLTLTSPPYPGTYDYAHHHQLRYPLFGDDAAFASKHEIGSRRAFDAERYRADLLASLARLRPARVLVLIGDGRGVRTDAMLREAPGWKVVAVASQSRRAWAAEERAAPKREHLALLEPA